MSGSYRSTAATWRRPATHRRRAGLPRGSTPPGSERPRGPRRSRRRGVMRGSTPPRSAPCRCRRRCSPTPGSTPWPARAVWAPQFRTFSMTSPPSTSGSRAQPGRCFAGLLRSAPSIVAESLAPVADPLATALRAGPWTTPDQVAAGVAHTLGFESAPASPPAWLRPAQVPSFRRVLAALHRHGGALLADPVGSGKTFVALAVARALTTGRRPTACLVPAALIDQWRATADTVGVPIVLGSHEAASRGRLPDRDRGLVLIDEAHRFRHPQTRRYRRVAPWLVGRRVMLMRGKPVVNRLEDKQNLLLLDARGGTQM